MNAVVALVIVLVLVTSSGCITRPGMNRECRWPHESETRLDLSSTTGTGHLVVDAELIEELVDRYRFHPGGDQQECRARLTDAVAQLHGVSVAEVLGALFFLFAVLQVRRAIFRRFADEVVPAVITLTLASVVLSGLMVMVGEFWTSILQMIRVGSQHVGGRVAQLPWHQHEREIFLIAICVFWVVVLGESVLERRKQREVARA